MDRNSLLSLPLVSALWSLSARRAWIEIGRALRQLQPALWSLSARRAWIEIPALLSNDQNAGTSLSARRAWIEIPAGCWRDARCVVALRKESVDRNYSHAGELFDLLNVALRKESVDRTARACLSGLHALVALRKESVDRNPMRVDAACVAGLSLSARRAWIEISRAANCQHRSHQSLSARRAWIEMPALLGNPQNDGRRSPQGERG